MKTNKKAIGISIGAIVLAGLMCATIVSALIPNIGSTEGVSAVNYGGDVWVFKVAANDKGLLYHQMSNPGGAYIDLGGQCVGSPFALVTGNTLRVFVTGTDGACYYRTTSNGGATWTAWTNMDS